MAWLNRHLEACSDVARLMASHPTGDAVVEAVDGRQIKIGGQWLADFASCNYLGLDLDEDIVEAVPGYLRAWETHPSWSRGIASPVLYERIEEQLCSLLGAEDVLTLPTLTHIHNGVLPVLAADGTLLVDIHAHRTLHDAAVIAKARGADVRAFAKSVPSIWSGCCALAHHRGLFASMASTR